MAKTTSSPAIIFLTFLLLITPPPSQPLPYSQYRNLFSLAHSLMTRVANLRAARGDYSGSDRARNIAAKMDRGLGLGVWGFMWSAGWDYVKNYSWRDLPYSEMYGAASEANELMSWLGELTRKKSDTERAAWITQNYQNVFRVSTSLLRRLLRVFTQSVRTVLLWLAVSTLVGVFFSIG